MNLPKYDALLLVSFGGPNGPDDVMPFLENVLRGRNVPHERMLEVAEHYQHFGGVSPINQQNEELIDAIRADFLTNEIDLPVYWGNRNWYPLLAETLKQMKQDGIQRALAFFTSIYSCYSGCRQYRENIIEARSAVGEGVPIVDKLRMPFNHPSYIEASVARVQDALGQISGSRRPQSRIAFTAHSIPMSMASGSNYVKQLMETCRLIMQQIELAHGNSFAWELVFQSRSGPPTQPWLEPDICDHIHTLDGVSDLVIMPVGFISDHMEVLFDLDTEAKEACEEKGINLSRAHTVGTHPSFVKMIRQLVLERTRGAEKLTVGELPASHDVCPIDCCQYQPKRHSPAG